jgi:hypothetical protein
MAGKATLPRDATILPEHGRSFLLDHLIPDHASYSVYLDYSVRLKTSINPNNYILQVLIHQDGGFFLWKRWFRSGVDGQNNLERFADVNKAITEFKKRFKDKTKRIWPVVHYTFDHEGPHYWPY